MKLALVPSNALVRVIYCISLAFVVLGLLRRLEAFNFKAGLGIFLLAAIAPTVVLLLLAGFRFVGVAVGKFKLEVIATAGPIYLLRMVAIAFMFLSVAVAVYGMVGVLTSSRSDGVGYSLVSGILGGGSPVGLLLFEASRILERELLPDSTET